MDRSRLILALALSLIVLMSWPVITHYLAPRTEEPSQTEEAPPQVAREPQQQSAVSASKKASPTTSSAPQAPAQVQTTQAAPREITIVARNAEGSPYWKATFTNRGAVATSWILSRYKENGVEREITGADNKELQLLPQEIPDQLSPPLSLRTPWSPELGSQLNRLNYEIAGVTANENEITLGPTDSRTITFRYSSPSLTATKTFTFHGDSFVFDTTAEVKSNGSEQPVEIVLGPRFGDQSDRQTGSYSTPPQVIAYTRDGQRQQILGSRITPPFATIIALDAGSNQIELDKPLAADASQIKITADKGATFIGYARVLNLEANGQRVTVDALPPGTSKGNGVSQGVDTLRQLYRWAGVADHYFALLAVPDQSITEISLTNIQVRPNSEPAALDYPSAIVPAGSTYITHIFIGPKDRELLASVGRDLGNANLGALIDYGFFSFAVKPLVPALAATLNALARFFGNYGWAIVGVTVIINIALSPLRFYSSKKMKKAAKHQPRMKELQDRMKKLKENPKKYERELQELQQEQMALMKEANPLGGCLPMILQLPIFWAVYLYLGSSLDVRHAPWVLWIHDLSRSDPLKILPIVMCVTMIASTMLTPQPQSADPSMKMQRIMMTWLMPIMLTWLFFFSAPSGLVLYWMVSNVVGVLIQLFINRRTAELTAAGAVPVAAAPGAKSPARATDKASNQKTAKNKGGKRGQERRGGAEAEGF